MSKEAAITHLKEAVKQLEIAGDNNDVEVAKFATCKVGDVVDELSKLSRDDEIRLNMEGRSFAISAIKVTGSGRLYLNFQDETDRGFWEKLIGC